MKVSKENKNNGITINIFINNKENDIKIENEEIPDFDIKVPKNTVHLESWDLDVLTLPSLLKAKKRNKNLIKELI